MFDRKSFSTAGGLKERKKHKACKLIKYNGSPHAGYYVRSIIEK